MGRRDRIGTPLLRPRPPQDQAVVPPTADRDEPADGTGPSGGWLVPAWAARETPECKEGVGRQRKPKGCLPVVTKVLGLRLTSGKKLFASRDQSLRAEIDEWQKMQNTTNSLLTVGREEGGCSPHALV